MEEKDKNKRYLPHTLDTRYNACKMYQAGNSMDFVCRKFKVSYTSLMRWNKRFDGTRESLMDRSKRPKSNPIAHTEEEVQNIKNYLRRNPDISLLEIYHKLVKYKGYKRPYTTLTRFVRKNNLRKTAEDSKKN